MASSRPLPLPSPIESAKLNSDAILGAASAFASQPDVYGDGAIDAEIISADAMPGSEELAIVLHHRWGFMGVLGVRREDGTIVNLRCTKL
ncbi:MAG TPA: hypothetical protein PKV72_00685 [Candidatus Peribacteria bacterium]|nr:hypothetical protein [Candidatus Peribacteria bacterium]